MPITKSTPLADIIHDFVHSDNPKFAGKSKEERIKMAKGAFYGMQNEEFDESVDTFDDINESVKPTVSIAPDGTKEYRVNGKLHRTDGPAVERANGDKEWYVNGKRHRKDGPAIKLANGTKIWFVNGKRHRLDGPAIERATGTKIWCVNDELHRIDGPAIERASGDKEWYVDGKEYTEAEFKAKTKSHNESVDAISERTIELLDAISSEDTIAATKLFNAAIMLKLAEMIEERRQEVAQNMFESVDENTKYGVFRHGGGIGIIRNNYHPVHGVLINSHDSKEAAASNAKLANSQLSKGEKHYYGIKYHVKPLTTSVLKMMSKNESIEITEGDFKGKSQHYETFVNHAAEIATKLKSHYKGHPGIEDHLPHTVRKVMSNMTLPADNPNYKNTAHVMPNKFDKTLYDNGDKNTYDSHWLSHTDDKMSTVINAGINKSKKS